MTPLLLQDALTEEAEEALGGLTTATGGRFRFFTQELPPPRWQGDPAPYPYCLVRLGRGADSEEPYQRAVLAVAVHDPDETMRGHRDVLAALQCLRERFGRDPTIHNAFRVDRLKWDLGGGAYPVFTGELGLRIRIPTIEIVSNHT